MSLKPVPILALATLAAYPVIGGGCVSAPARNPAAKATPPHHGFPSIDRKSVLSILPPQWRPGRVSDFARLGRSADRLAPSSFATGTPLREVYSAEGLSLRTQGAPQLFADTGLGAVDEAILNRNPIGPVIDADVIDPETLRADPRSFDTVLKAMELSGEAMELTRGWRGSNGERGVFAQSRSEIAKQFRDRSSYVLAVDSLTTREGDPGEIVGTIGLTVANGESENLPLEEMADDRRDPVNLGRKWKILHEGKRPKVLIEARSYEMKDGFHLFAFPNLLSPLNNIIRSALIKAPELWDEKIIYSYADEVSCRLYPLQWGFEVMNEKDYSPIQKGTILDPETGKLKPLMWKVIRISPKRWFENHRRFRVPYRISNESAPIEARIPGIGRILVAGNPGVKFSRAGSIQEVHLQRRARIRGPIWVAERGIVRWLPDGVLWLWGVEGSTPGSDIKITPGIWAKRGRSLELRSDGRIKKLVLARPAYIKALGRVVPADHLVEFEESDPAPRIRR